MIFTKRICAAAVWLVVATGGLGARAQSTQDAGRQRISMDKGWRFALGNAADPHKDFDFATVPFFFAKAGYGDGPASVKFDDRAWRSVDLPHDWAVELPFDSRGDGNHGSKAIGRNFPENSVGWYRRAFDLPKSDLGRRIVLEFDGVYRNSEVWVNGFYMGTEPSGYKSFHYDVTDYLNYGGSNLVTVRADATREEGWFYEGAGIYRHVWLTKTAPVHVGHDGTFVSTAFGEMKAGRADAEVTAAVKVQNDGDQSAEFTVEEEVKDAGGLTLATARGAAATVAAAGSSEVALRVAVPNARLWSLESPYLHTLVTTVKQNGRAVDRYETPFGMREIRWDANRGFFLNGEHVELKGTNMHQDAAGVGVALPDDLMLYRVRRLKEMGSNAIRMSHNPPTPELLAACDRLGMLVLDENRMMGSTEESKGQLQAMIERDRNHPSVILWSVGNEEWSLEWSVFGERLTRVMMEEATRLDPTRPATVALSGSGAGNSLATEVFGFNYFRQHDIDKIHARFPDRPSVGTEESSSEHTRGTYTDDRPHQHLVAYDDDDHDHHATIEEAWQYHAARPFSAGLFYWTGFDYRGETTPFGWPAISSQFGMLDTCGFFKDNAYLLQSFWTAKPMVHLLPHWNWPGQEGKPVDVRVYSNAAAVELSLNGTSLGRKQMPVNGHLAWQVSYAPGKLVARGFDAQGKEIASDTVQTTGNAARVELVADKKSIAADGTSLAVVTVRVVDAAGLLVPEASDSVRFDVAGPARIIGVGNGDPSSHEADKFVEQVSALPVTEWRTRSMQTMQPGPELQPEFDDSAWEAARDPRWNEKRVDPERSVYRGSFTRPADAPGARYTLLFRVLGDSQSVYLNGHLLGRDLGLDKPDYEYELDAASLRTGRNSVVVYASRLSDKNKNAKLFTWEHGGPVAIRRSIAPAPWARSVFHGLAQVIVQSTGDPGETRLTATGAAPLQPGVLVLSATPVVP
jgi:beta-galactosidase